MTLIKLSKYILVNYRIFIVYGLIYLVLESFYNIYIYSVHLKYASRAVEFYFLITYLSLMNEILKNHKPSLKNVVIMFDLKIAKCLIINLIIMYFCLLLIIIPSLIYSYISNIYGLSVQTWNELSNNKALNIIIDSILMTISIVILSLIMAISSHYKTLFNIKAEVIYGIIKKLLKIFLYLILYILICYVIKGLSENQLLKLYIDSMLYISVPVISFNISKYYMLREGDVS